MAPIDLPPEGEGAAQARKGEVRTNADSLIARRTYWNIPHPALRATFPLRGKIRDW
jgi:hypothetical protein